jgi:hypothetical protein
MRPIRPLMSLLILVVALVVSVEAGTKKAPAKAPLEPIDKMLAKIREGDPKGVIVAELQFYASGMPLGQATDDLQIVVTNHFHRAHYQERYQLTQLWAAAWKAINGAPYSRVFVTDRLGNLVARGTPHLTWVQTP